MTFIDSFLFIKDSFHSVLYIHKEIILAYIYSEIEHYKCLRYLFIITLISLINLNMLYILFKSEIINSKQ